MTDILFPARLLTASGLGVLSTTTGIDGTAIAVTNLYTVPSGRTAVIIGAIVRVTALAAFVGVGTGGIGTNGTQDNILGSKALTGLTAAGSMYPYLNTAASVVAASGQVVALGIDVAFVAGTATLAVDLIGYLI